MPHITSANVACGFHAGDPGVMRSTVALARDHGVAVGAHPGFPDLVGFGRRERQVTAREVEDLVAYQIGALGGIAAVQGVRLRHVKPHGALYTMAARERQLADAIARAVKYADPTLVLVGLSGSELVAAGREMGLRTASEAFADRAYAADGSLLARSQAGAVIRDPEVAAARAVEMVRDQSVTTVEGGRLPVAVETLCVHSDTPGAAKLAAAVREALLGAQVTFRAMSA